MYETDRCHVLLEPHIKAHTHIHNHKLALSGCYMARINNATTQDSYDLVLNFIHVFYHQIQTAKMH